VQDSITARLVAMGYSVRLQDFTASPRRLYAPRVAGTGLGWVTLGSALLLTLPVPAWSAVVAGGAALAVVALIAYGIAEGHLPIGLPQVSATNIIADRGVAPAVWLVAHSDSKAQSLSLSGRVMAVSLVVVGGVGLGVSFVVRLGGPLPLWQTAAVCLVALTGAIMLTLPPIRGGSPGAVDNASGVIAALAAAEALRDRSDVGVLITDAEEFGMEGARAFVKSGLARGLFVNFDGVDGVGAYNVMQHKAGRSQSLSGAHRRVRRAVTDELSRDGTPVRRAPLPLGVFVDGSVLAKGGMAGVTVSRGTWHTLQVIHTARDDAQRAGADSPVAAGTAVAGALASAVG
jgi:Peptidase family M28